MGLLDLQRRDKHGAIRHVFPLHDHRFNQLLRRRAATSTFAARRSTASSRRCAATLGTRWPLLCLQRLLHPLATAVARRRGALVRVVGLDESQYAQILPLFAMGMCAWAAGFIKAWQRRANRLAMEWGTYKRTKAEVVRKEFHGEPRVSAITNGRATTPVGGAS